MRKISMNTKERVKTINEAFDEFQQFNKVKDLSEATVINYDVNYKKFAKYYDCQNLCNTLDVQVINNFIMKMKEERNSK